MGELVHLSVGTGDHDVVEAGGTGDRGDAGRVSRKEVDCIGGGRAIAPASFAEEGALFSDGVRGLIRGIDAEHDDLIVLAGDEGGLGKTGGEAVLHLGAEHGAFVIDLGHDSGLSARTEPGFKWSGSSGFVGKDGGQWQGLAKALLEASVGEVGGCLLRGRTEGLVCGVTLRPE